MRRMQGRMSVAGQIVRTQLVGHHVKNIFDRHAGKPSVQLCADFGGDRPGQSHPSSACSRAVAHRRVITEPSRPTHYRANHIRRWVSLGLNSARRAGAGPHLPDALSHLTALVGRTGTSVNARPSNRARVARTRWANPTDALGRHPVRYCRGVGFVKPVPGGP